MKKVLKNGCIYGMIKEKQPLERTNMNIVQTISLPIIVSIVYAVMGVLKAEIKSERFNTFIPLISATLGAVIGVVIYFGYPECIPAGNVCAAIIIGARMERICISAPRVAKAAAPRAIVERMEPA